MGAGGLTDPAKSLTVLGKQVGALELQEESTKGVTRNRQLNVSCAGKWGAWTDCQNADRDTESCCKVDHGAEALLLGLLLLDHRV